MVSLTDSVVVVTGAASGMGATMANQFAEAGASVVVADVDEAGVEDVSVEIRDAGDQATGIVADVSDRDSAESLVETTVEEYGTVDVLCNNAGVFDDNTPVRDLSEQRWDDVLHVNLKGQFLLIKAALPTLQAGDDEGVVINTASVAGKAAGGGGAAYTASKHGVIGLTKQLAHDYGPAIRANAICPGYVETGMTKPLFEAAPDRIEETVSQTPAGRYAQPEEVARVAVFLASDDASFVHGTAVDVDGGWQVS